VGAVWQVGRSTGRPDGLPVCSIGRRGCGGPRVDSRGGATCPGLALRSASPLCSAASEPGESDGLGTCAMCCGEEWSGAGYSAAPSLAVASRGLPLRGANVGATWSGFPIAELTLTEVRTEGRCAYAFERKGQWSYSGVSTSGAVLSGSGRCRHPIGCSQVTCTPSLIGSRCCSQECSGRTVRPYDMGFSKNKGKIKTDLKFLVVL